MNGSNKRSQVKLIKLMLKKDFCELIWLGFPKRWWKTMSCRKKIRWKRNVFFNRSMTPQRFCWLILKSPKKESISWFQLVKEEKSVHCPMKSPKKLCWWHVSSQSFSHASPENGTRKGSQEIPVPWNPSFLGSIVPHWQVLTFTQLLGVTWTQPAWSLGNFCLKTKTTLPRN